MGFVDAHMTFGHETMNGLTEKNLIFLFYFFVFYPPSTWCFPFNSSRTCRMVAIKVSLMLSPEPKVSPWINHRGITVSLKKMINHRGITVSLKSQIKVILFGF